MAVTLNYLPQKAVIKVLARASCEDEYDRPLQIIVDVSEVVKAAAACRQLDARSISFSPSLWWSVIWPEKSQILDQYHVPDIGGWHVDEFEWSKLASLSVTDKSVLTVSAEHMMVMVYMNGNCYETDGAEIPKMKTFAVEHSLDTFGQLFIV